MAGSLNHLIKIVTKHGTCHHLRSLNAGNEVKLNEQGLAIGQNRHIPTHKIEVGQAACASEQGINHLLIIGYHKILNTGFLA